MLHNRTFSAFLSALLILFLTGTVLVLFSNVWYLAQASDTEGRTGWAVFVTALHDPEVHFAIRLSVISAFLTMLVSLLFAIPAAYLLSRHRAGTTGELEVGLYRAMASLLALFAGAYLVWGRGWQRVPLAAAALFVAWVFVHFAPRLARLKLSFTTVADTIVDLPIVVPPPVIGMSLLMFFQTPAGVALNRLTPAWLVHGLNGFLSLVLGHPITESGTLTWVYTTRGIVMAQFFVACAFGLRAMKATFDTIGTRHEDVARTLGCTRTQAFVKVVLPMAASGLVAGGVMTWARAIAEFGPVLFFCGSTRWKTEVMPISMFLLYSSGEIEKAVALVIIMITISALTLLAFKKLGGKGYLW
jgi:molybdate transport system permease protein